MSTWQSQRSTCAHCARPMHSQITARQDFETLGWIGSPPEKWSEPSEQAWFTDHDHKMICPARDCLTHEAKAGLDEGASIMATAPDEHHNITR